MDALYVFGEYYIKCGKKDGKRLGTGDQWLGIRDQEQAVIEIAQLHTNRSARKISRLRSR